MRPSHAQLIVAGSVLVDLLGYGMIMPLLPYLLPGTPGANALLIGGLSALYAALQALAAPLLGALSDRVGRRPILLLCLAGSATAYLLLALAAAPWQIAVAIALAGAAGSSLPTAQAYVTDSTPPDQRTAALGLLGAAFGLGIIGGALLGGLLSQIALALPPFAAALLAAINTLIAWRVLPESRHSNAAAAPRPPHRSALLRGSRQLRLLPALLLLNSGFAGMQSVAALYTLQRFGWTPLHNGLLFAVAGLTAAVTQIWLLGRLHVRFGDRGLLRIGLLLFSGGLLPLGLITVAWFAAPLVALIAAGMGLAVPALTALLTAHAAADQRGALLGRLQMLVSLALISGPLLAALLFNRVGPAAPFSAAGLGTLLALAVAWPALRAPRAAPLPPGKLS